jgi:hypothetical protein
MGRASWSREVFDVAEVALNLRHNHIAAAIRAIQNSKRSMMGGFLARDQAV